MTTPPNMTAKEAVARALVKWLGFGTQMDDLTAAQETADMVIGAYHAWLDANGWKLVRKEAKDFHASKAWKDILSVSPKPSI